ncbi:helix-turn-helix transcriptional regulator [Sporosarcina sp. FSL K6-5500]|uniref:helix-turn-helix transcriptional regulator n=1 Tax=Sporosarcina sp. FSL K6-5500 TaxID=2921558 RepID=UPI0030FC4A53
MNIGTQNDQVIRVLSMYERLCCGHSISKRDEAGVFQVNEKTIQRDIEKIRRFLETSKMNEYLEYDREDNVYRLDRINGSAIHKEEILAIIKVLLESRAFLKEEMFEVLTKLTRMADPAERKFITVFLQNEKHLYEELQYDQSLLTLHWKLAKAVHRKQLIKLQYKRENDEKAAERLLKPVGLLFSEFYFYMIAYQTSQDFDFPTIYRLDRIKECTVINSHFKLPYSERFQEGEFRKRVQFMHTGELMTIRFRFTGFSPQAVLDRLPTAKVLSKSGKAVVFEAEVYGKGIKMWLLSQGDSVEVLHPEEFRLEMTEMVNKMANNYH